MSRILLLPISKSLFLASVTIYLNLTVFTFLSLHFNAGPSAHRSASSTSSFVEETLEITRRSASASREDFRLESSSSKIQQPSSGTSTTTNNTTTSSSSSILSLSWNRTARNHEILDRFAHHPLNPLFSQRLKGTCPHARRLRTLYSSMEYVACCGLGHRLARMSAAAHVAAIMGAGLHSHWGCCQEQEVFSYMFGDEPMVFVEEQQGQNTTDHDADTTNTMIKTTTSTESLATDMDSAPFHVQFRNEVPGMPNRNVIPVEQRCPATHGKRDTDFAFYTALMQRYKKRNVVLDFMQQHGFDQRPVVVGIHVRAGNGETGDFAKKNRHIPDEQAFVASTVANILNLIQDHAAVADKAEADNAAAPLLFIATDTPHYVSAFREALMGKMDVIDLPQQRPKEGEGVLFGMQQEFKEHERETCFNGWDAVFQDMMILSHADIVIAAAESSFTQSMPLSMVLGRPRPRKKREKIPAPFCEVKAAASGGNIMQCYESHDAWSCQGIQGTQKGKLQNQVFRDVAPDWRHLY